MGFSVNTGFYVGALALVIIAVLALTGHCGGGLEVGLK